jgi:hypothetical protein
LTFFDFQILSNDEDRDVWSAFLAKGLATGSDEMFDLAYEYSKSKERKDNVTRSRAEFYFKEQKYEKAALYFGQSGLNFEEVVLRLLSVNESLAALLQPLQAKKDSAGNALKFVWLSHNLDLSPIRIYLLEVLKSLPPGSKSQRTLLCTWLCEIYLYQINKSTASNESGKSTTIDVTPEFMSFLRLNK